jgi:HupE / UreJ protein
LAALAVLFCCASAFADAIRPAYLELREEKPGEFSVLWKIPMLGTARLPVEPEFSGDIKAVTPVTTRTPPGAAIQQWTLGAPTLRGQTLRIRGLEGSMTDVLVRIEFADGTKWVQRLTGAEAEATIPMRQSGWSVAGVYLKLGIEHILFGADHLLFVLGLLLIVKDRWMLLKTITAFTVAHSITLGVATLGYANVPDVPLNAAIALSILFLGPEIVRSWRGQTSFTIRNPWVVAFAWLWFCQCVDERRLAANGPATGVAELQRGRGNRPIEHCGSGAIAGALFPYPGDSLAPLGPGAAGIHRWIARGVLDDPAGGDAFGNHPMKRCQTRIMKNFVQRVPQFAEVESEVKSEWIKDQRAEFKRKAYGAMKARYEIVLPTEQAIEATTNGAPA